MEWQLRMRITQILKLWQKVSPMKWNARITRQIRRSLIRIRRLFHIYKVKTSRTKDPTIVPESHFFLIKHIANHVIRRVGWNARSRGHYWGTHVPAFAPGKVWDKGPAYPRRILSEVERWITRNRLGELQWADDVALRNQSGWCQWLRHSWKGFTASIVSSISEVVFLRHNSIQTTLRPTHFLNIFSPQTYNTKLTVFYFVARRRID